jgi:hypothetical protein
MLGASSSWDLPENLKRLPVFDHVVYETALRRDGDDSNVGIVLS